MRHTVSPAYLNYLLRGNALPRGIPAPLGTAPPAEVPDLDGLTRYEAELDRLRGFHGVPHDSPIFGPVGAEKLRTLSCVHAAHHLSFLVPNDMLAMPDITTKPK